MTPRLYWLVALWGGATLLLLWQMLLPGYILSLDMVWTPYTGAHWASETINNAFPFWALIGALGVVIPSWILQKVVLVGLFVLLLYIPYRFLPLVQGVWPRAFAAAVFALNPFVYSRMLAGQWFVLVGYALLPAFFAALFKFEQTPSRNTAVKLALWLALIGVFSIHLLYLALGTTVVWLCLSWRRINWRHLLLAAAVFIALSSYYLVPAVMRPTPLEARFDTAHFEAFAASVNATVPVMLNVAVLGGYWGEGTAWSYYFVWPQHTKLFWAAAAALAVLIAVGIYVSVADKRTRRHALFFICIGAAAYITALGAADTPFKFLNTFLYDFVPGWGGLRDSTKIVALLAVVYALFAGLGLQALAQWLKDKGALYVLPMLFMVPACLGLYEWGGFHKQLTPTFYPVGWEEAYKVIHALPDGEKVLVLPWHGYLSLEFADQRIVANPARAYFGPEHVIASRSVDAGNVVDQEIDPQYRELDHLLTSSIKPDSEVFRSALKAHHISYILIIKNSIDQLYSNWTDAPEEFILQFSSSLTVMSDSLTLVHVHVSD